jgi:hypothetical protein
MPVHDVYQPALIKRDVIALRRRPAGRRLRDEIADFARGLRIGNVDDAQPAAEPDRVDESPGHALAELVRAKTCAARAAERGIEIPAASRLCSRCFFSIATISSFSSNDMFARKETAAPQSDHIEAQLESGAADVF